MNGLLQDPMVDALAGFLDVNVFRNGLIISNLANVDTPGYHTRDINFQQELARSEGDLSYAEFSPAVRQVRNLPLRPDGNNVNLERETLLLAETQIRFNTGVQLLRDYFKSMLSAIHEGSGS